MKINLSLANKAALTVAAALFVALVQGVPSANAQGVTVSVQTPTPVVTTPVVTQPVVQDNYVYYPNYGVYYSPTRHQYFYQNNNAWVWGAAPVGVDSRVILGSPSVRMNFHDSPAFHHKDIVRQYPRNWAPANGHADVNVRVH